MAQEDKSGSAASATNPFTDEFREYVNGVLERRNAPGLAIAVIDGEDVFTQGYGHATLPDVNATGDTLYYTGSCTKAFTAALIDHLIQSKKYPELANGWDTPIVSLIHEDFVLENEWMAAHATLRDAAGHMTGFGGHDFSLLAVREGHVSTAKDTVRSMRHLPIPKEPRLEFHYSNHMYAALAHVAETLTGKWLGDLFKEHIWDPLGMKATFMDEKEAETASEHLATSLFWDEEKKTYTSMPPLQARAAGGAGGIISTVADHAKWVKCLLHQQAPFSEATHKQIRTPLSICAADDESVTHYTLGWFRSTVENKIMYDHPGSTGTFGSTIFWIPEAKYGIVAFSNSFNAAMAVTTIISQRLIQDKLQVADGERIDWEARVNAAVNARKEKAANVLDKLYPDRPVDKVLPSSAATSKLAGRYSHPAYGTFEFVETDHPDKAGVKVLEAVRDDCFFIYRMRLEHVSGDFWISRIFWLHTGSADRCDAAQFKFGVDGNPTSIALSLLHESPDEGTVELTRDK